MRSHEGYYCFWSLNAICWILSEEPSLESFNGLQTQHQWCPCRWVDSYLTAGVNCQYQTNVCIVCLTNLAYWLTKFLKYVSTFKRHRQWVIITTTRFPAPPARRHPLLTTSDYNSFILFRFLGFIEKPIESSVMFGYVYRCKNKLKCILRKIYVDWIF